MRRIHLLTGFALDRRVLECLNLPGDRYFCHDLIAVEPGERLEHYALRLAGQIGFAAGEVIGGVSLGGMLALEIARQCGAKKVILLASCTHPRFIRLPFHMAGAMARAIPGPALHHFFLRLPTLLRRLGMHTAEGEAFLRRVMGDFSPALLRQLPKMMMEWPGCEPAVPCSALHCQGDWLIRPPLHLPGLQLLPGKNHLVSLSHPDATRRFLREEAEAEV